MLTNKKLKFGQSLMLGAIICLSSCMRISYDYCPVYPVAGKKVAAELEKVSYAEAPNTWEWLERLNKLREELELCKN